MGSKDSKDSKDTVSLIDSVIGEGAKFTGDLELDGFVRIDGDFIGTINCTNKILVSKTGRVKSSINARSVVVAGSVVGDIYASEEVDLLSTALVVGNITAPVLFAEDGVIFHGVCDIVLSSRKDSLAESISESDEGGGTDFFVDWNRGDQVNSFLRTSKTKIKTK